MANLLNNLPKNATQAKEIIVSFENALKTCSYPSVLYSAQKLPGVNVNFHELATILSGVPTVLCCLISFYIICGHMFHWVNPKEQKQIVLCIAYLPIFTLVNFFAGWFFQAYDSIVPILTLYNVKGLIAVFLLYVAYLCPEEGGREAFHAGLERRGYYGKKRHDKGSLRWFRIIWVMVFQLVPLVSILFPITYVVQHLVCPLDSRRTMTTITLGVINFVITATAWNGIYFYYRRTKSQLKEHRGSQKLNIFQTFIALQSIQALIFPLVTQTSSYYPTIYVSYQDFSNSIPALMTCWESLIFAVLFLKVFTFTPYRVAVLQGREQPATVGRAVLDCINQMDIVRGTVYLFQILVGRADRADSRNAEKFPMVETRYASVGSEDGEMHDLEATHSDTSRSNMLRNLNSGDK